MSKSSVFSWLPCSTSHLGSLLSSLYFTFQRYLKRLTCLPSWGFPHSAHTVLQSCGFLSITSNFLVYFFLEFLLDLWNLEHLIIETFASFFSSFCTCVLKNIYLFIWLHWALVVACGIQFSDQGSNLGPVLWECRVLATGPPGKSLHLLLKTLFIYTDWNTDCMVINCQFLIGISNPKLWVPDVGIHLDTQFGYPRDISNLIHQNLNLSPISSRTPLTLSFKPNM